VVGAGVVSGNVIEDSWRQAAAHGPLRVEGRPRPADRAGPAPPSGSTRCAGGPWPSPVRVPRARHERSRTRPAPPTRHLEPPTLTAPRSWAPALAAPLCTPTARCCRTQPRAEYGK
jgi:hypothetical protein